MSELEKISDILLLGFLFCMLQVTNQKEKESTQSIADVLDNILTCI